jgi:hypothetical protein
MGQYLFQSYHLVCQTEKNCEFLFNRIVSYARDRVCAHFADQLPGGVNRRIAVEEISNTNI